jgi:hypothetical protein
MDDFGNFRAAAGCAMEGYALTRRRLSMHDRKELPSRLKVAIQLWSSLPSF